MLGCHLGSLYRVPERSHGVELRAAADLAGGIEHSRGAERMGTLGATALRRGIALGAGPLPLGRGLGPSLLYRLHRLRSASHVAGGGAHHGSRAAQPGLRSAADRPGSDDARGLHGRRLRDPQCRRRADGENGRRVLRSDCGRHCVGSAQAPARTARLPGSRPAEPPARNDRRLEQSPRPPTALRLLHRVHRVGGSRGDLPLLRRLRGDARPSPWLCQPC